jgi:hypothetical protein
MLSIFIVKSEKEDKQRKHDRQSPDANDGQPAQNLRQNIGLRIDHRHHPGEADKNTVTRSSFGRLLNSGHKPKNGGQVEGGGLNVKRRGERVEEMREHPHERRRGG